MVFFLQMAATPQEESLAARVPINSASRRINSSSGFVQLMPRRFWKRSPVSDKFSKGSLDGYKCDTTNKDGTTDSSTRDRNEASSVYGFFSLAIV